MGILIIEKKEWITSYEQMKSTAESAEMTLKSNQAAHLSALAEAKKREEKLKKALGIEKECVSNVRIQYFLFITCLLAFTKIVSFFF